MDRTPLYLHTANKALIHPHVPTVPCLLHPEHSPSHFLLRIACIMAIFSQGGSHNWESCGNPPESSLLSLWPTLRLLIASVIHVVHLDLTTCIHLIVCSWMVYGLSHLGASCFVHQCPPMVVQQDRQTDKLLLNLHDGKNIIFINFCIKREKLLHNPIAWIEATEGRGSIRYKRPEKWLFHHDNSCLILLTIPDYSRYHVGLRQYCCLCFSR